MQHSRKGTVGLACAGGGMEGCIYEIGALCALDEAVDGLDVHKLDVYVGVSAGALVASCLANGISARAMSRAMLSRAADPPLNINPNVLFSPAVDEFAERMATAPRAVFEAVWQYLRNPLDLSPLGVLYGLGAVVPVGLFDNAPLDRYLAAGFSAEGRTNNFQELAPLLRIVAVNVDTAEVVTFGDEATAQVPISKAVQASTALPGLYVPVEIDGAYYIDGVARRTVHASAALQEGVDLLFCVNPLVPVNTAAPEAQHPGAARSIVHRGLPPLLAQSFRTLIHSRMRTGFRSYAHLYPDADLLLIEPTPEDYGRIFSNLFSFSNRQDVCEHAYRTTLQHLREHAASIEPMLERHGLGLRWDVLSDNDRVLYSDRAAVMANAVETLGRLESLLDRLKSEYPLSDS